MKMHDNRNNNMESFYEENAQYVAATTQSSQPTTNSLKRPLTLDLNAAANNNKQHAKKQRFNQSVITPTVLNSPDLNMLKLATPDLEKFIISNTSTLQTPTPSLLFANPIKVTSEQEDYARGFVDALNSLRNSDNSHQQQHHQPQQQQQQQQQQLQQQQNNNVDFATTGNGPVVMNTAITTSPSTTSTILSTVGMSGGSITYTNLDDSYPMTIKDEPQTVPNSPPMSPIDMENQEKIKLERKRQRNRVAASKCRKRKLERISKLEDKVKVLKGENVELGGVIKSLKEHVFQLKQQVIDHINNGCNIPTYNVSYFVRATNDSDIK